MSHVILLDEPVSAGGNQLARVGPRELVSCTWRESISGDRGTLTLALLKDGPSVPSCAMFNVVRAYDSVMQRAWEYRITRLIDGPHLPTVTAYATDLSHELGRVRLSQILGGVENFSFSGLELTPDQWIDTLVLPALAAAGITWVIKGTVTPKDAVTLNLQQSTCGAVMSALESGTKFEWWLEPNSDANYRIMLARRTATGTPRMWVGHNVKTLEREIVADEKFFNRAIPQGATVGDETERSGMAQHGWKIAGVTGDDVGLEHPQAAGDDAIGCDDQLNGLVGGVSLDGVMPPRAMAGGSRSVAWDAPRQTVWWVALRTGSLTQYDVCWHSYATGASGRIQVSSSTDLREAVIDATRSELLVVCADAGAIERIDLVTRASVGSVGTGASPSTITNLRAMGIAEFAVGYEGGGAAGPDLFSLTTLAGVATLDDGNGDTDHHVMYDSGSSRYVTFTPSSDNVSVWNAAHAFVAGPTAGISPIAAGITGGVIHVIGSADEARALTVSTGTFGSVVPLPLIEGAAFNVQAWIGFVAPLLSGKLYVVGGGSLVALDTTSSYAISGLVGVLGGLVSYDATDDVFLVDAAPITTLLYRNGNNTPSGRLRFVVQDTDEAGQTIEKPSATKGPLVIGQQLVEFRADTADTYRSHLEDPVSVAAYGPVDGWPQLRDGYKRNYKMDPRMSEWVSDGVATRPRWMHWSMGDATNAASLGDLKWAAADAPPSRATAALVNDGGTWTVNVPDTLGIDGLTPGYVVHAGALLSYSTDTALSVVNRAVANGGGAVTLDVIPLNTKVIVNNDPITVHQPAESDALGDFMLGLPVHDIVDGRWPLIAGAVHLPSIAGASQASIRFRYLCLQFGGNRESVRINFSGHGSGNIDGENVAAGTFIAPIWSPITLAAQIALNTVPAGSDHFLRFSQDYGLGATATTRRLHLWLQSIEVYILAAASLDDVAPIGEIPGDELAPWTQSNYLLFDDLRASPSFHYKVEFIERPNSSTLVAQTADLRDPASGIRATPRIADIGYRLERDAATVKGPEITLQNRVPNAMEALAGVGN